MASYGLIGLNCGFLDPKVSIPPTDERFWAEVGPSKMQLLLKIDDHRPRDILRDGRNHFLELPPRVPHDVGTTDVTWWDSWNMWNSWIVLVQINQRKY